MRVSAVPVVVLCCVLMSGCDAAKITELSNQVQQLQQRLANVQQERDALQEELEQVNEIREGYEEARGKFQQQLSGLTSSLGADAANPLPPFEQLKNSQWVGKLLPAATTGLENLKELQQIQGELLKELRGEQSDPP